MFVKVLDHQSKQVAYNIYLFFKARKRDHTTVEYEKDINLIHTVAEATGLSRSTVTRIIARGNKMKEAGEQVVFQKKKGKHTRKKRIKVDEPMEGVIRRRVIRYYKENDEVPSIRKLNALLKDENILCCSNEYLRMLLHKLGFTNTENDSINWSQCSEIVLQRLAYLKRIKELRASGRPIFYLSDTKKWTSKPDDKEQMPSFIMLHASGPGFCDGTLIMVKGRAQEKSLEQFENFDWIKDTVVPNVPPSSVFVINVPLYMTVDVKLEDVKPSTAEPRCKIEEWLNNYEFPYKETDSKVGLLKTINEHLSKLQYNFISILKNNGHEILHLPTNHQDLNPAAIAWEELSDSKLKNNSQMMEQLTQFSKEKWEKYLKQALKNETEYYDHDIKQKATNNLEVTVKVEKEDNDKNMDTD